MSTLHTVNKSPFEKNSMSSCLSHSVADSAILMIEDGVYGAIKNTSIAGDIDSAVKEKSIYVLGPDLKARGLNEDQLIDGISVVDYAGFVELVCANDKVQNWL
ncbi:MAG: sulfurtransferase complex subunit TusB [gamma proteobacterium symbiont of Bathyaustriella thionipta]|nr:sulfurtransferase complex subunit TusB [gamma proteobacterium symbiont of Bathyaustriella thionipta]